MDRIFECLHSPFFLQCSYSRAIFSWVILYMQMIILGHICHFVSRLSGSPCLQRVHGYGIWRSPLGFLFPQTVVAFHTGHPLRCTRDLTPTKGAMWISPLLPFLPGRLHYAV